ncbi:Diguanylate phosphodiesterase [Modestobacter italicus]|uniref:Diguanylate phosphodiesterase n=1 Tax=Modestobacter italicus (strain DSM 44449 / CECT 9708 / BC 501) TaxID=2732864 RepID=I4F0T0_MODI5|nr:EAL domain-containing protein [Modestobacter marinus]CCH89243.1 Diguanylate phosphodiesterase [Modestobacter marinus]
MAVDWAGELDRLLCRPNTLNLVFQPIIDVARGRTAGYEALARFTAADGTPSQHTPDLWFAAADTAGMGARVEAMVLERCLQLRTDLPPNCFLTVNVSPHLLTEPELADPLLNAGDLAPLVLELTEHQDVADLRPLLDLRDRLRDRGALVALDDAGSGYSGLQQPTAVKPQIIKLDRALVADADTDDVKLALAQLLGEFGGRIDAWLLAEGVETWGEMDAFVRLGVPLAQGYLLGRPSPPWATLDPEVGARLRQSVHAAQLVENVASLVEPAELVSDGQQPTSRGTAVRVDEFGHPIGLLVALRRDGDLAGHRAAPVSLRVPASAAVAEVAQRVVTRPEACRFDPIVVVDDVGAATGVLRVESLLTRLASTRSHSANR